MKAKLAVLAILPFFAVTANAEPAPWHVWQSRLDGKTTCAQTSPGAGWEANDGPFSNARCRKVQTQPSGTYDEDNSAAKRFAHESQPGTDRKNRMMELMAIFVSARASR
jgi:hypothetical protein